MMKAHDIAQMIDHSLLRPNLTSADVTAGCTLAREYNVATVCLRPADVRLAAPVMAGSDVALSTVIGFPHGTNTIAVKVAEAVQALENGVTELDVVMNYGRLLSGDDTYVAQEVQALVHIAHDWGAMVKIIFENCYLDDGAKQRACGICTAAGADFVKTSTGFGTGGATIADVLLMRKAAGPQVRIKAAGGIRELDAALAMAKAGATRIGATATKVIMEEAIRREAAGTLA